METANYCFREIKEIKSLPRFVYCKLPKRHIMREEGGRQNLTQNFHTSAEMLFHLFID